MPNSLLLINGSQPGTKIVLDPDATALTIGRHVSRELQIEDDRASRLHAQVTHRAGRWHLDDCDSLNGTFVNSQPIKQTVLEPGDLIRIADTLILFVDDTTDHAVASLQRNPSPSETIHDMVLGDPGHGLVERNLSDSMSRIARDSAVLCRLANLLQQHSDSEALIQVAVDAVVDGIDPDSVAVWLVGPDGRLRLAGRWGQPHDEHLLASLAVEKGKAILLEGPSEWEDETVTDTAPAAGTSLGVPIPGPQVVRGALECHRRPPRGPFSHADLDFTVVVAHQMGSALENLEHRERLELANEELRRRLAEQSRLAGTSAAMLDVLEQIARVGPTASTVLILGESGTGKELVARSIHECSAHAAGPYVPVNCAAFSESLLESELFGHEPGAFTGADRRHVGQFERAHRGTIFLDEIGEMSLACQAKLLRILEGHPFERLGGQNSIHVEVRVVAATHRDLREMVGQGSFREDLFYRLRVIDIQVPPLRERDDDALALAALFLQEFRMRMGRGPSRLSEEAIEAIRGYAWPGNVRELKNSVERAVVLGRGEEVTTGDLGLSARDIEKPIDGVTASLKEAELNHIRRVLRHVGGNKTEACRILGIGRGTLYKKLENVDT